MRQNGKNVSPFSNEARNAYTIEHITLALLELLKNFPFSEITISEICAHAGVGRASFYRNFEGKEDVLKKWLDKVTDNFVSDTAISFEKDSSTAYFTKLFIHMAQYREICSILYRAGLTQLLKDEFDRRFLLSYRDIYGEFKSCFLSGGIFNIVLLWLIKGCPETPEAMALKMTEVLTQTHKGGHVPLSEQQYECGELSCPCH